MTNLAEQVAPANDMAAKGQALHDSLMLLDRSFQTDSGMATLLAEVLKGSMCWTPGRGWLIYKEGIWEAVNDVAARERVRQELDDFWRYTVTLPDFSTNDLSAAKALLRLVETKKIDSIFKLMTGVMQVDDDIFDRDPFLLCVGNGVVDMSKAVKGKPGQAALYKWQPEYYMTKKTPYRYRPNALAGYTDPGTIDAILMAQKDLALALEALPLAEDVIWLQARLGQAATGQTPPDQRIVFATGGGSNGKSVLMGAAENCLGTYATRVHESLLASGENMGANMSLMGVRLAFLEELPMGHMLPDKVVKDLTDEKSLTGRHLYKNMVTFKPSHSLFVTTNYRPIVSEIDESVWRRLKLLSFPLHFVPDDQPLVDENDRHGDTSIKARMWEGVFQQEAMLAWIIEGAVRYWPRFDKYPERIEEETNAWRNDSDTIRAFLHERTEFDPDGMVSSQELYTEFKWYLDARGNAKWAEPLFAQRLGGHPEAKAHRVTKTKTRNLGAVSRPASLFPDLQGNQINVWTGLRWKTHAASRTASTFDQIAESYQTN